MSTIFFKGSITLSQSSDNLALASLTISLLLISAAPSPNVSAMILFRPSTAPPTSCIVVAVVGVVGLRALSISAADWGGLKCRMVGW
eukprot:CAMPEP_0197869164 /NCGR_PEP_ID=MMETSP1438-20131217/45667_1 /TAXON_ID=1461541 /ORGANISM="Pterosperma sp., Strain CCMP1384" /LENGTH=86 /DNA_ID=CAMNT_0043487909 /DNA_START=952 /DNA_END=1209 /DNA_ORIENTATION=+